jgi:hypothetical protein
LVTQGAIATNADELIRPTLEARAGEEVWVVATTGGKRAEELGSPIPFTANGLLSFGCPTLTSGSLLSFDGEEGITLDISENRLTCVQ